MPEKEGYEVIRFIERGAGCYISIDYVKGITLYRWVEENSVIEKPILQMWIREIARQLALFHKQKGNPDYDVLNPYNIIIAGKNKIALMSVEKAKKNQDDFSEKYFTPLNGRQDSDMYCLGKIIQFIMSHVSCEPSLTKKEEYKLLRIVRKCLEEDPEHQYEDIQKLESNLLKVKNGKVKIPEIHVQRKTIVTISCVAVVVILCSIWYVTKGDPARNTEAAPICEAQDMQEAPIDREELKMLGGEITNPKEEKQLDEEQNAKEGMQSAREKSSEGLEEKQEESGAYFDIALSYFLELKDYAKSGEYFRKAGDRNIRARYYAELADFMQTGSCNLKVETVLEVLKAEVEKPRKRCERIFDSDQSVCHVGHEGRVRERRAARARRMYPKSLGRIVGRYSKRIQ